MTTGFFLSGTFGCSGTPTKRAPRDEATNIVRDYVHSEGDDSQRVAAPEATKALVGLASYQVDKVGTTLKVAGLDQDDAVRGTAELTPTPEGVRLVVKEGSEQHVYIVTMSGAPTYGESFSLRANIDGTQYALDIDPEGRVTTTGDLRTAPGPASLLVKQMVKDMSSSTQVGELTAAGLGRCAACFACGLALGVITGVIATLLFVGWPAIVAAFAAFQAGGMSAAIASLVAATGMSTATATALLAPLAGLAGSVVWACYVCAGGAVTANADDTCSIEDVPGPEVPGPELPGQPGPSIPDGPGGPHAPLVETCACPIEIEAAQDIARDWIPAFGN